MNYYLQLHIYGTLGISYTKRDHKIRICMIVRLYITVISTEVLTLMSILNGGHLKRNLLTRGHLKRNLLTNLYMRVFYSIIS